MIIINFKICKQSFGENGVNLAKICKKVADETGVRIVAAVPALMATEILKTGVEVFLQNYDEYQDGKHSGSVSPAMAKELGIKGSLLNHSERPKKKGTIFKTIKAAPQGFETILCVKSIGQIEKWAYKSGANYIAYEPKYLIASKTKSVSTEQPEAIRRAAVTSGKIPLLAGAGVKCKKDVEVALEMGAKGVLVASDVVCAKDPVKELMEMAMGFKNLKLV